MFCRKPKDFMWNHPFFSNCAKDVCDGQCSGCGPIANIGGNWTTVVVGFPHVWTGVEFPPIDHHTESRFLPKILVELGFFSSNSAAIRQNKDWKLEFPPDEHADESIRLAKSGKRKGEFIELVVGPVSKPDVRCNKPSRVAVLGQSWDTFCRELSCGHCCSQEDLDLLWRMRK